MKLQNLCTVEDGTLSGPMSPMLLMQDMSVQMEERYCGICRVWWDDDRSMQLVDEDSGLDTVVYLTRYGNGVSLSMFVDTGIGAIPVAVCFVGDETIFAPVYEKDTTLVHPDHSEILDVFKAIAEDMSKIIPVEKE